VFAARCSKQHSRWQPELNRNADVFVPDFSGQGSFRITPNELTLRNVWLGTKQATRKPDICELTFARK